MQIVHFNKNLFTNIYPDTLYVQCISADFAMGAGIAVDFNNIFNTKNLLIQHFMRYNWNKEGYCLIEGQTANLVTKQFFNNKPTIKTMRDALESLKRQIPNNQKLAMPIIGCGLDKLDWNDVLHQIYSAFEDTECQITVCYRKKTVLE